MNLIPNPSFEVDLAGWVDIGMMATPRSRTEEEAFSGVASQKIVVDSPAQGARTTSLPVAPNVKYTASAYVRAPKGAAITLNLNERTEADSAVGHTNSPPLLATGGWDQITVTRLFGATGTKARVQLVCSAAVTFYLDAVALVPPPSPNLIRFKTLAQSYGAALLYAPESDSDPLENLGSLSLPDGSLEGDASLVEPGLVGDGAAAFLDGSGDYIDTGWETRTNWEPNPRFAVNADLWLKSISSGVEDLGTGRAEMPDAPGEFAFRVFGKGTEEGSGLKVIGVVRDTPVSSAVPISPGDIWTSSWDVYTVEPPTPEHPGDDGIVVTMSWYSAAGAFISTDTSTPQVPKVEERERVSLTATAPEEAAFLRVGVRYNFDQQDDVIDGYFTNVLTEKTGETKPYFPTAEQEGGEAGQDEESGAWDIGPFARGTARTFVGLYERASDDTDDTLFGGAGGTFEDTPHFWLQPDEDIAWRADPGESKVWVGAAAVAGTRQMVALAFNDPADTVALYVDGSLVSAVGHTNQFKGALAGSLQIGARSNGSIPFHGSLLPFAVFTKELADWQVSELHRAASGLPAYSRIAVTREYPPDRLAWHVNPPGGAPNRWASDEPDPANVIDDINLDSEVNGGYKEATGVLPRDPHHEYSDLAPYADVSIYGPGVQEVWNGRLEKASEESGERKQIKVECAGWWNALEDDKGLSLGFVNVDIGGFRDPSTSRRLGIVPGSILSGTNEIGWHGEGETPPAVLQTHEVLDGGKDRVAEAWWDGGGVLLGQLLYDRIERGEPLGVEANWDTIASLVNNDTDPSGAGDLKNHKHNDASQQALSATAEARRYARLFFRRNNAGAEQTDDDTWNVAWENLCILSWLAAQNLALQGEWPNVGYTAKQMLQLAVPLFASPLKATDESMEDDGFVIPQAWYSEPGTMSDVVNDLTKYGLLRWFVYEDKLFQLRFRENFGRTWIIRSGTSGLEEVGIDAQRSWRSLTVRWQDVAGDTRTAGPPGSGAEVEDARLEVTDPDHPAVLAGLTRRDVLNLDGITTQERAIEAGARFLEEANLLNRSGKAQLKGYIEDDKAVMRPASQVKAGDKVIVADSGDRSPREITSCSYSHSDRTASVSIDAPAEDVAALLARYGAALTSLSV